MISFIVPAHNEEALIGRTLDSIHGAARSLNEAYEILVVDDSSTDATAERAATHGAKVVPVDYRQISRTRNAGAAEAQGEVLIFVDADTIVNESVVTAAVHAIRDGAVGGGCTVRFDGQLPLYARLAWPLSAFLMRLARMAAGCFVFCTRNAFEAVGGFSDAHFVAEEIILSRALGKQGRFTILRESVITSGRKLRSHSMLEIAMTMLKLMLFWWRVPFRREGLDLWYGPRRSDRHVPSHVREGDDATAPPREREKS